MRLLDTLTSFEGIDTDLVLMSSYTFNPTFFESRILRTKALSGARRVVVFVDAGEWERTLELESPARWLNYRYLLVPVRRSVGVFHPKVVLMLGSDQCRLLCGSGNVTQAGYAYNLELHNRLVCDIDDESPPSKNPLLCGAFEFFREIAAQSKSHEAALASKWLGEAAASWGFAKRRTATNSDGIRFVHTLNGGVWTELEATWNERPPEEMLVVSPFYDSDLDLLGRIRNGWPKCRVRVIAQQRTSLLDARRAVEVLPGVRIESLDLKGRRLHAKMLAWRIGSSWQCLVGSANFTSAAMDGRNVEACLWIQSAEEYIESLFDDDVRPTPIDASEFISGESPAPENAEPPERKALRITSASLDEFGSIKIGYQSEIKPSPEEIVVAFRGTNDMQPAWTEPVRASSGGRIELRVPEHAPISLSGAIRVTLIGEANGHRVESLPAWLIHESRLTHEASGDSGSDRQREVRESGKGLPEYLDELAKASGAASVIEYLESLNIRFYDGQGWSGSRRFVLTHHDPFRPDVPPDWILALPPEKRTNLARAIMDFADRHERGRILRHARRGNINGIENFLDILMSVSRMVFIYYRRGLLKQPDVLDRLKRYVTLATIGTELQKPNDPGYLATLAVNLRGDPKTLKQRCEEANASAIIRAVLFLAQFVRSGSPVDPLAAGTANALDVWKKKLAAALKGVDVESPTPEQTVNVLREMAVFSEEELQRSVSTFAAETSSQV